MVARLGPNGTYLLTVFGNESRSENVAVRRLDHLDRPVTLTGAIPSRNISFGPDGIHLLQVINATLRIWSTSNGKSIDVTPPGKPPFDARFSSGDDRVVVVSSDGIASVLGIDGEQHSTVALGPVRSQGGPNAIGDDGAVVIRWSDKGGWLWRFHQPTSVAELKGSCPKDGFNKTVFSEGGKLVLRACLDAPALLWRLPNPDPISLKGEGGVVDAAFSSDASLVLTVSHDGPVSIWNTETIGQPLILPGESTAAALNADGKRILVKTLYGSYVWRTSATELLNSIAKESSTCLTAEERSQYLGEQRMLAQRRSAKCEEKFGRKVR